VDRPVVPPGRAAAPGRAAGAFHASFEHQDLLGINARSALAEFVERYPDARGYPARMLLIDRVLHAVHAGGGPAARNLLEAAVL